MKIFKKTALLLAVVWSVLLVGCSPADRHFWYPVTLKYATCGTFKGEIYVMENSIGWRSWPYYLEKNTKKEIELGTDCIFRTIRHLHKPGPPIQKHLTSEQREYLIEGFDN